MPASVPRMRAVRCVSQRATLVTVPEPVAADDQVVVNVASAAICGSDLHLLELFPLEATLGHEFAGHLADGTPVAVEPLDPCGTCDACTAGDYNRCAIGGTTVLGVFRDGGMADKCLVPARSIVRLPATVDVRDACLIEPLAVAVHGLRRGAVRAQERVAVIGGGALGQCAIVAARAQGIDHVDAAVRHDRQREAAERLGARLDIGDGYHVVIESAGSITALEQAIEICRPGGRVIVVGTYWDGDLGRAGMALCSKEVTLIPAFMYSRHGDVRDIDEAAAVLAARPDVGDAIITHRFPLDAAAAAFETARDRKAGAIKVVLEP
jgi:threonine dehydrogenase-like Zn-dependent dehydrogenase